MDKQTILNSINFKNFYTQNISSLRVNGKAEALGLCPFHSDHNPSLSVNIESGLYNCFACGAAGDVFKFYQDIKSCDFSTALKEIAEQQGITETEAPKGKVVATFEYKNAEGKILYIKERIEPGRNGRKKDFIFKHLGDNNNWVLGRGCDPVPYMLPLLIKSKYSFIIEGEGKADLLVKQFGLTATCLDSGAQSPFKDDYLKYFEGKEKVVILPDNDIPGKAYADKIASALYGKVTAIKIIELPGLQEAGDILDWVKTEGNDKAKLLDLIQSAPEWKPQDSQVETPSVESEDWPEPIPFNNYDTLPDFPVEALTEPGRKMVEAVAAVNQVDAGLPATIYLSVISACVMQKGIIDLISHREPLNVYTCEILFSGERKSTTLNILTKPIYEYQETRQLEMRDTIRQAFNAHKIREAKVARLQKQAANSDSPVESRNLEAQALELLKEMAANPVPALPVFVADDITPEKTAIVMAENRERLSILSTEGGIFSILAGRYNDKGINIDLFLKSHSGDPYSCHRVGRDPQTMQAPCLSVCLTVQPDIIKEIGQNNHFRGRGLLARFLYTHCRPQAGHRDRQIKSIPESLLNEYSKHLHSLLNIPLTTNTVKLSTEAQSLWDEFYNDIESEMRTGSSLEYLKDWGSKLPGAVARIAGLLHFAEYGAEAVNKPISVGIVGASCTIGAYFKEHAIATFGLMQADQRIEFAKLILDYILRHKPVTFKGRDVLQNKNAFKTMDDVSIGLKILIERGYIREINKKQAGTGRPEATAYEVNKKIQYV